MMAQKLRVPLGFAIAAAVLYFAEPTAVSIVAGLPVALIGVLFRALAAGVIKKDSTLAVSGVYALTRNPLYFGSSLLATGFAIMSANEAAAALLIVPFGLIYPTVMLREKVAKDVHRVDGGGKTRKDNRVDDDLVQFVGS